MIMGLLEREAYAEMKTLRDKLPSGSVVAALQNFNDFGDTLGTYAQIVIVVAIVFCCC